MRWAPELKLISLWDKDAKQESELMSVTIEISERSERRMEALGVRDKQAFAQQALEELISEMEDARVASERLSLPQGWVSQEELERELGLDG